MSINVVEQEGEVKELFQEERPKRLPLGSNLAEDTQAALIEEVVRKYKADFSNNKLLITFDATPRADDVLAILFSVVDENFYIIDRLAALRLFASSLNGLEYYDVILDAMEKFGVNRKQVFFCNADRGGGNKPCVRNLGKYCKRMTMSWCIPHTL
jgi:hypothetical protein